MSFDFCDGFDSYAATADLVKKWRQADAPWAFLPTGGRFGGGAAQAATTGGGKLATQLTINDNSFGNASGPAAGFHFKASGPPASISTLFGLFNNSAAINGELRLNTAGNIALYMQGSAGAALPNLINICDGNWHWVEFWYSGAFGQSNFSVYVDAINCGTVTIGGGTTPIAYYQFTSVAGITITIDDLVCWSNGSGAIPNSFPLGPRLITTLRPVSDGVCTFATLSAGTTHFSLVNEVNPDGDTTYVEDGTSGNQDLLNFAALGYTPTNISCAVVNAYMKTGVAGTINNAMVCKSGAATSASASTVTTSTYTTVQGGFGVDPNNSAAWTLAGLNAAQFGYKNA